jgi:hypothetical protein
MKKLPSHHQDFDDFGIRLSYNLPITPQPSRPTSGVKIGFQMNATPLASLNNTSCVSDMGVTRLNIQNQHLKLPTSRVGIGLRDDFDENFNNSTASMHQRSQRSADAMIDRSRSNSRPSTANYRDIGGGDTRRSSTIGGSETRRSSLFGGADTRRSSVYGSAASECSSESSRRLANGTLKDFGSVDSSNNEIILTNGNLSGLIQILTNFLWLAAGEKRFSSKSVLLILPEVFSNASLFQDEFTTLEAFCCSELEKSSTLHSYIAELVALATWQKFKTRMSMFFLFGGVQGPLSPDQRSITKQFSAKLQDLAVSLCGNLEKIQFQVQLRYEVLADSFGLEDRLLVLLEKSNKGITEAPPPEFSMAIDQFVRNQAQAHISPPMDGAKITIDTGFIFNSSKMPKCQKSASFTQKFGAFKLGPQDLQEQVEHLLNDRAPYWFESPQSTSTITGAGEFFVKEILRTAEKESFRSRNTMEALKAAQNKIMTLEKRLSTGQSQEDIMDLPTISGDVAASAQQRTPMRGKSPIVSKLTKSIMSANSAIKPMDLPKTLNAIVDEHYDEDKNKTHISLETSKYQLTTGIEMMRIVLLADSMKGTTFEYSGQFGTGTAGLLARDGSGRCEWKSPGGFLCWYVGDWRDDRPHGWGRSGRGALVESGIFEEGRLSLKGWPEILDSGTKSIAEEPRWPAQRNRSEATIPDPEPTKLPSARISPPAPPASKKPPWYLRLSSANPVIKEEKSLPQTESKPSKISVDINKVFIESYKPFCCFWSEGSCEKCPSDGDSMSLSEAYRMGCIASYLAQENAATSLEKSQQKSLYVLVCTRGNESCNIILFGNKLVGLPQEYAGSVSPQTRMRNGFGISIWHSVVYGTCWCVRLEP